ncbi:MAG: 30S ribosome-binding factor RbfA, partial [bacterium]|nr:30S ribosome-binding factor RbfA [bacterium]
MAHRIERFTSTLKTSLADILRNEVNNPRLGSVLITDVVVNPDLKKARIYVCDIVGDDTDIVPELNRAVGFLKRALAKKMYLKYVPELVF